MPAARSGGLDTSARLTVCSMIASLATAAVLFSVIRQSQWYLRCAGAIVGVAVIGGICRALRVPRVLTVLVQVLGGLFYCTALYASEPALAGFVPHRRDAWDRMYDVLAMGFTQIGELTPRITATPGIEFIVVGGVAIMALVVDILGPAMRQTALAGLPLLVLYTIPAAVLPHGLNPWYFLLPAAGYLLLLLVESRDRMLRWGVPLAGRTPGPTGGRVAADLNRMSRRIGLAVLALAVLVPMAVPLSEGAFGGGGGVTGELGGKTISTLNPLVSLRRELVRPDEFEVMTVKTDATMPSELYLRTVTLDEFNGEEWKAGRRQVQKFETELPPPPGQSPSIGRTKVTSTITVSDRLASDYLPLPYPATHVDIDGSWRVDLRTSNVVSHKGRGQITGKTYRVASNELLPLKADVLEDSPTSEYLQPYLQVPDGIPVLVSRLAKRIAGDADGVLEKGLALQRWFRSPRNFTYDLSVRPGTGQSSILDFLHDRRGYCEQFASTMALMARMLGIPARVDVGFTAGRLNQDGLTRRVSSHDAHAWPELYLPGVGWTRFEPTPGSASSSPSVPSWLADNDKRNDTEAPDDKAAEPQATPEPSAANGGPAKPDCAGVDAGTAACGDPDVPALPVSAPEDSKHWWENWKKLGTFGLALLLLVAAPALARLGIRWRRWTVVAAGAGAGSALTAGGARVAETAWRELRDCAVDLGYAWPEARTPRQTSAALTGEGRLSPAGAQALATITRTVERVRYAPAGGPEVNRDLLRGAVDDVRRELAVNAETKDRVRARIAPRSLAFLWVSLRARAGAVRRAFGRAGAKVKGAAPGR